jgi:hypothetical protein
MEMALSEQAARSVFEKSIEEELTSGARAGHEVQTSAFERTISERRKSEVEGAQKGEKL